MKFCILAMTLVLVGCAPGGSNRSWEEPRPVAVPGGSLVPSEKVTRSKLGNGVDVLVLEDHRLPRVVLGVTLRRGAGAVDRDRAGLADFTAALMERGAGDRGALELARAVDEIGASFAVSAGWDSMRVSVSGLSRDLDRLLEILADTTLRPRFEASEAAKVVAEQRAALRKALEDPNVRARWETSGLLYPGHRYGRPVSGTPASLENLGVSKAREFHGHVFVPGNAILSVSSDAAPTEIRKQLERRFGDWKPGAVAPEASAPPSPTPGAMEIVVVDRPDLTQARIFVAQGGIPRRSPDRIAAILVNSVLGGSGFSSRLMAKIRGVEGLVYGVHSGFAMRRRAGPFAMSTSTRVAEAGRVVDLLLEEFEGIRQRPPTEAELARVKSFVTGRFALNLETSDAVIASLVSLDVYDLPEDSLETYRSRVAAVDTEGAARVARDVFHPENVVIVVVGPAAELVPQLERRGGVRVVPNDPAGAKGPGYSP